MSEHRPFNTVERARGRWREILPRLGVDTKFLKNKHGPCPICGGVDRYRFDDKNGDGTYFCNQCGPGTGVILVRKMNQWDHATACRQIDNVIGTDQPEHGSQGQYRPRRDNAKHRAHAIRKLLWDANDPEIVGNYLSSRGVSVTSAVLLGNRACEFFRDKKFVGRFPAIIAPILGPDGKIQSAHRIYITDRVAKHERKKLMPPVDTITGAAVRLHDLENGVLGVSEGVETALAAYQLHSIPTWASLNEGNLQAFEPPSGAHTVHIFGDNDSNFVGQNAAYALAKRLGRAGKIVHVHIPPRPDTDWLDVLNGYGARH